MASDTTTLALAGTAAWLGFVHTILGPDHYLPFVMMSWARKWSGAKTALITFLCGLGHVAGSVVLGMVGVAIGAALDKLELIESRRGDLAAWLLIGFGLAYLMWGIRRLYRGKSHVHSHTHLRDGGHAHPHTHLGEHSHVHTGEKASIAPWTLFIIFVFGPCEPLIPILMYPAAKGGYASVALIALVFSAVTIGTMLAAVLLARRGVNFLPMEHLQRYAHVLAGAMILLCGLAIVFLGL